jgi:hypothetical protein
MELCLGMRFLNVLDLTYWIRRVEGWDELWQGVVEWW